MGDDAQKRLADQVKAALGALALNDDAPKSNYAFWSTQPVVQFGEEATSGEARGSALQPPRPVEEVRAEPYPLPKDFEWVSCDVEKPEELTEIYELLCAHYVEDDDNMFRFAYSSAFLGWALQPPGFRKEWHAGIRVRSTGRLVAFISAIPATVRLDADPLKVVEINFLCVHKKLRSKRLAPVLIKEITRRVHVTDTWQAVYTAGVVLPTPVAEAQYWHRSLNPRKLVAVGFTRLAPRMTMARMQKLLRVPDMPVTPGVRAMRPDDVPAVTDLLAAHLGTFRLAPCLSQAEVAHWLLPREDVLHSYVVEDPQTKRPVALLSFYTLPSTVIGHDKYDELRAAYQFYCVPGPVPSAQLMADALVLAHATGHDVFNALDIFDNADHLADLKFGVGDGKLRYYIYNWRAASPAKPSQVGLVML